MGLIEMAETGFLSPDNTTVLYRLFSVLKIMLQQSTRLREHIQEYYTEEFRYISSLPVLLLFKIKKWFMVWRARSSNGCMQEVGRA